MTAALRVVPAPPPLPGHEVLDQVRDFVARFNVFPSEHCAPMLALWYAHTWAAEHFYATPRLILSSAEPGSGKTRVLEVAQHLVRAPEMTFSISPAAIFRLVTQGPVSLLFDEIDAVFNPKTAGNYEDLRALLNAGYKRTATVARCVGDASNMAVARFAVYAPVALAGIAGGMPSTITTRAITVHMRKSAPDEKVEQYREKRVEREAGPLKEALAAWVESIAERVGDAEPAMPDGVTDRPAEIWEPLLAVADAAGDHWPNTARAACSHFVLTGDQEATSLGVRLLSDLYALYTSHDTDRMTSEDIIAELCRIDEAPWGDLYGKGLNSRILAKELGRYGVKSKDLKLPGNRVLKGYRVDGDDGLADAWRRHVRVAATSATCATAQVNQVADNSEVADTSATAQLAATGLTSAVAEVAQVADTAGKSR